MSDSFLIFDLIFCVLFAAVACYLAHAFACELLWTLWALWTDFRLLASSSFPSQDKREINKMAVGAMPISVCDQRKANGINRFHIVLPIRRIPLLLFPSAADLITQREGE